MKNARSSGRGRFRVPAYDSETDEYISYMQVMYGEYVNRQPVIRRVWVYEEYFFSAEYDFSKKPSNWWYEAAYQRKVCGLIQEEKRSTTQLAFLEKVKNLEFKIAWDRLSGWNMFMQPPSKEEMEHYVQFKLKNKISKGHL